MIGTFYLLVVVSLVALVAAVTIIYTLIYRTKINQRLTSPVKIQSVLWSPMKVCIVSVIAALAFCTIIFAVYSVKTTIDPTIIPSVYVEKFTDTEMQNGYLLQYSIKENDGYEKHEKVFDNIKYTYFISKESMNPLHPSFLIYAEYIGLEVPKYHDIILNFRTSDGSEIGAYMVGGCEFSGASICLIGNASGDCNVSCIVDIYNALKNESEINFEEVKNNNTPLKFSLFKTPST